MYTDTIISDSGNSIAAMTNNSASAAHVRQVIKHLIPATDSDEDSSQSECGSNGPSNTHGTFTSNSYDKKDVPLSANEMHETSYTPYLIPSNTTHHQDNVNTNKINVNNNNIENLYAVNEINASAPLPLAEINTAAPIESTQSVLTTATDKDELHSLHSFLTSTSKLRLPRRTAQKCFSSSHSEHDEMESNMLLSAHENESNTTNHLIAHSITTQVDDHNDYRDIEQTPNNRWLKREELRKLYAIDDSSSICSSSNSKSSSSYTSHEEDVNEVSDIKNDDKLEPTDNKTVAAPTNTGTSPSSTLAEEINSTKTGFQQNQEEEHKKHEDDEVNKLMEQHDDDNDDVDTTFENVFKTKRTNNNNFTGLQEEGKYTNKVNNGCNERDVISTEKKENTSAKNQSITDNNTHRSSNAAGALQPLPYVEDEIDEWQLTKTIEDSQGEVTNLESGRSPSEASQAEFLPESPLEQYDELEKEQKEEEDKKGTITNNKTLNEENIHVHVNEERLQEKYEPSPLSDYAYDHDLQSAISFPSYAEKSMTSMNAEHLSSVEKEANNDVKHKEKTEHSLAHAPSSEKELNSEREDEQEHEHEEHNNSLASETHKVYVDKKVIESVPTWVHRLSSTTNKRSTNNNSISSQRSNNSNNSSNINKSKNVSLSRTPRSRSSSNASINSRSNGDYNMMHTSQSRLSQKSASVTSDAESKRSKEHNRVNINNTHTKMESREVKSNTSSRSRSQSIPDWVNRLSTPLARRSVSASASRSSSVASFTQTSTKRFNPRLTPHETEHDEEGQESTVMQSARSLSSASHSMSEMHQYHSIKSNRQHSRSLSSEVNTWRSAESRPYTILTENRVHTFKEKTTIAPTPKSDMKLNTMAKKSESRRSVSLVNKEHTLPRQPNTQSTHSSARSTSTPIKSSRSILSASEERKSLLSQRNSGNLSSAQVSRRTSLSHHSSNQSKKSNSLVIITESKQDSLTNYVKELQQRQQMQSGEEEEYYEYANEWQSPSDPSHHSASSKAPSQTRINNVNVAEGRANHSNDSRRNNYNGNNINSSKSKNARNNGNLTSSTLSSANQTGRIATRKNTHPSNESIMHTLRLDLRRREDRKELHKQQYCVDPQLQMRPCKRQFHITPQLDLFGVYERHNMTVNSARSEQPHANNNWTSPQKKTTATTTATVVGKGKPEWQSKRKPFVINSSNSARVRAITRSQSADNMKINNDKQEKYKDDISMLTRFVGGYDDDNNNENGKVKTLNNVHTYRSVSGKRVSRVNNEQYNAHKDQLNLFSWNTFDATTPTSNRSTNTNNNNGVAKIKSGRRPVAHRQDHLDRLLVPDRDCNSRSFSHRNDVSEERHFLYNNSNNEKNEIYNNGDKRNETTPYRTASQMMAALRAHFEAQPENTLTPRRQKWTEYEYEEEEQEQEERSKGKQRTAASSTTNPIVKTKRLLTEVSPRRRGRSSKKIFTPHLWKDDFNSNNTFSRNSVNQDVPIQVYEDHDIFGVTARNAKLAARAAKLSLEQQQQQRQIFRQRNDGTSKNKRQLSEPYGNEGEEKREQYNKRHRPTLINVNNDNNTDSDKDDYDDDNDEEEFQIFTVHNRANMHNHAIDTNCINGSKEERAESANRLAKRNNCGYNHVQRSTEPIALQNDEEEEAMLMFDLKRREQNTPLREPVEVE